MANPQNSLKKRLFIAIDLPRGIKSDIFDLQQKLLRRDCGSLDFVPRLNLHITISFLGDQCASEIKKVKSAVYDVVRLKHSFKIELARMIFFKGDDGKITLLALEAFPTRELKNIRNEISKKLKRANVKFFVGKRFIPHITIARIKSGDASSIKKIRSLAREGFKKMIFVPDAVDIMESIQTQSKSRIYKSIYGVILRPPDVSKGWFNE